MANKSGAFMYLLPVLAFLIMNNVGLASCCKKRDVLAVVDFLWDDLDHGNTDQASAGESASSEQTTGN